MQQSETSNCYTIDRRSLIRNFLIVSAGVVFLPACRSEGSASIVLKNISLTAGDEALLASLCETLLPATDTPGARDLSLHLFVMKMMDDCMVKKDQEKILNGLEEFKKLAKQANASPFAEATPARQADIVRQLETGKGETANLNLFYTAVKKFTIQGYTTSKYFLTKVHKYELVPGRFHGCVPVTDSTQLKKV